VLQNIGYISSIDMVRHGVEATIPLPEDNEVVVFQSFLKAGLHFLLHWMVVEVLKRFDIFLHQLIPNAIMRLGVFI
jgi:hypothetical protein